MTMGIIIGVGIFISIILLIEGIIIGLRSFRDSESRTIKKRLRTLSAAGSYGGEIDIVRKRMLSEVPWLNRVLLSITRIQQLDKLLEQANTRMPLGFFLLLSALLVAVTAVIGSVFRINHAV